VSVELVVTDLDGTLWHDAFDVHPRTRAALAQLATGSIPVLVATGRRVRSTHAPLDALGLTPPAVVLNGALGLDLATGDRFHQGGYTPGDATAVLEVFRRHAVEPCVYVDDDDHPVWVSATPSTHPDHLRGFGSDAGTGDLAYIVEHEQVLAFGVLGLPESLAQAVGSALEAVATPHVDRDREYGGFAVTAAPTAQSKWDGVLAFCARNHLDPTAVLAIGDGPNDVELLANAAIAVAPDDAHASARACADHIVGRARDGGWAEILDILGSR